MFKFVPPQEISTERLIIRKIKSDQDVNTLSEVINPYFSEFKYDFRLLKQNLVFDDWLICLKENNQIIGEIALSFDQHTNLAEYSYYLGDKYLGKGYGSEFFQEFACQIIKPAIGKICDYVDNPSNLSTELVLKEGTLLDAYCMVDHINNYPSLVTSLKANAHVYTSDK